MGKKHASQYANFGWLQQKFHLVETKVSPARYKKFLQTKQLNCLQFHPDNTCQYLLTVLILLPHLPSASAG